MSKMREALEEVLIEWGRGDMTHEEAINLVASRYGDLEFTRGEVRGLLEEMRRTALKNRATATAMPNSVINEILSHHFGESESGEGSSEPEPLPDRYYDDTPTIKASEIERVTGEKVPEWAKYASKDQGGLVMVHDCLPERVYPKNSYHRWMAKGGCTRDLANVENRLISGPWQDSLRRIIHDEPKKPFDVLDSEVGSIHGELIALTMRVAAIEKRVLSDGHGKDCPLCPGRGGYPVECTCGHDQIQKPDPDSRV